MKIRNPKMLWDKAKCVEIVLNHLVLKKNYNTKSLTVKNVIINVFSTLPAQMSSTFQSCIFNPYLIENAAHN